MAKIRVVHADFLNHSSKINAKNVLLVEDGVEFETDKKTLENLKNNKINFVRLDKTMSNILKLKWGYLLGILLFVSFFCINNFRITKITFNGSYPINQDIEAYLEENLKNLGPFSFLDASLMDINFEVRSRYVGYAWINVSKRGNQLNVEISDIKTEIKNKEMVPGYIVSKSDAIIKDFYVYQGVNQVKDNQYVKKGDVLVLGNGLESRASIFGEVIVEEKVEVSKRKVMERYSGKMDYFQELNIFGKSFYFHKGQDYQRREIKSEDYFNLSFLSYKKLIAYQKCDIITIYDQKGAFEYAKTVIEEDFAQKKEHEKEKILQMEVLHEEETEDGYVFTFLIKKYFNIGKFVKE